MTFIMSEEVESSTEVKQEVKGFYYGEPNEKATKEYLGKLISYSVRELKQKINLPRILYWDDHLNNNKYILKEQYNGWGIYNHKTPSGYFVHQDWLITNGEMKVIIQSYNDYCKEEVQNLIDNYVIDKKMDVKAFFEEGFYIIHHGGNMVI